MSGTPTVQSLERALDILEALKESEVPLGLSRLSASVNLHRSTVHRLVATLEKRGYAQQDPETQRYGLGIRLLELGLAYRNRSGLIDLVQPVLDAMTGRTGHTSYYSVLVGDELLTVAFAWYPSGLKVIAKVGDRWPLYGTASGRALLSTFSTEQVLAYLSRVPVTRLTEHTITRMDDLMTELAAVRAQGYAFAANEAVVGVTAIAVPTVDPVNGIVYGALSLAWPDSVVPVQEHESLVRIVLEHGEVLNQVLSGRGEFSHTSRLVGELLPPRSDHRSRREAPPTDE